MICISLSHIYLLFCIVLWQSLLMMEEIQPHTSQINNPKYAVVIKKACFAWDQDLLIQNIGLLDVQITGIAPRDSDNGFKSSLLNITNACIIALYRWLFCWNILTFANLQFFFGHNFFQLQMEKPVVRMRKKKNWTRVQMRKNRWLPLYY